MPIKIFFYEGIVFIHFMVREGMPEIDKEKEIPHWRKVLENPAFKPIFDRLKEI